MSEDIDARGLSCPQPVLLVISKMKDMGSGVINVIVDNEVSRENVNRAALSQGWEVDEEIQEGDDIRLTFKR
jgi:tRNA 2-thiouridine synthesizing protein A